MSKPRCKAHGGRGLRVPPPILARVGAVLDHVGLVVKDLPAAVAEMTRLFGPPVERRRVEAVGLEAAIFKTGAVALEVLCFGGTAPGIDPRVFRVSTGFQHLAFRVDHLARAVALLQGEGFELLAGFPRRGIHGDIFFFMAPCADTLWELVERVDCATHTTQETEG